MKGKLNEMEQRGSNIDESSEGRRLRKMKEMRNLKQDWERKRTRMRRWRRRRRIWSAGMCLRGREETLRKE